MSLFLVFTKQYRAEEKIISELTKKIKKSNSFKYSVVKNTETYELDGIVIDFTLTQSRKMVVRDKAGEEIYSMNGDYDMLDEMQETRFNWFSHLLTVAREREADKQAKKQKTKKLKDAKEALDAAEKAKLKEQQILDNAYEALKRMKGL